MESVPFDLTQYKALFGQLKSQHFTGKLVIEASNSQQRWILFMHLGRLVFATEGQHPIRRFYRQLKLHNPSLDFEKASHSIATKFSQDAIERIGWEYELLRIWQEQGLLTGDQTNQLTKATLLEVLMDIIQAGFVSYQQHPQSQDFKSQYFSFSDPILLAEAAVQKWQAWIQAKLNMYSVNQAPFIKKPEALKQQTSEGVYNSLCKLLDGQNTLRDLASIRKRDVVEITASLESFLKAGLVELKPVADLATPSIVMVLTQAQRNGKKPQPFLDATAGKPLIACVDDSPLVCQTMEQILRGAGYSFLAIQDSLRALPQLLSKKPAVIFLDLVMPNTNGYEVCSQLRKTSMFKETPIVILTGNDGIVDRVRAKVVGATDFLTKPVDGETVLAVTEQYFLAAKS